MEHAARAATSSYASLTHQASSATNAAHQTSILATNSHFSSYYGNSGSRNGKPISSGRKPWVLPVIIVAAVIGAILVAAIFFLLYKRHQRQGGSYRNLEKPTLGEHREVFDARISEALESDANESLPTGQSSGDYAHPYGRVDTAYRGTSRANSPYRGPEKQFTDKSHDQGA